MKHSFLSGMIMILMMMVSHTLMNAQTYEGDIEVTEGRSHTVYLKNEYRDVLARANVVSLSWETASSDISITTYKKDYCEFKALRPTAKAILYYNCAFRIDGWYRTYNFYWEIEVKSNVVHVTNVYVYPSDLTLEVGSTKQLSATVYPEYADNTNVTWYSADSSVASVNSYTGKVTAKKAGKTKVWAYADDNGMGDYCAVTVTDPTPSVPVKSISIAQDDLTLYVGEKTQLNASVLPEDATNKKVNWSSSNTSVVDVDREGNIKGVGKGVAYITASSDANSKITDSILITVLDKADFQHVKIGDLYYNLYLDTMTAEVVNEKDINTIEYDHYNNSIPSRVEVPSTVTWHNNKFVVTQIGEKAFYQCIRLASIKLPNTITTIKKNAFSGCTKLASFIMPSSVEDIYGWAFYGCPITRVYISDIEAWCKIKFHTDIYANPMSYKYADLYVNNRKLTDLTLPDNVIMSFAVFNGCRSITSVRFQHVSESSSGSHWFQDCLGLKKVYLSKSVSVIPMLSFNNCKALTDIYCEATTPPELYTSEPNNRFTFKNCNLNSITLHVPKGCKSAYATALGWQEFSNILEDYDSAGLAEITTDDEYDPIIGVYNMHGVKVSETTDNLPAGIYIVHRTSSSKKIIIN